MTIDELIQLLRDEKAYIQEVNMNMMMDGLTEMEVRLVIVPQSTNRPSVSLISRSRHEKIKKHLPDELFEIE